MLGRAVAQSVLAIDAGRRAELYTRRLHGRVVLFRNIDAGSSKYAYHRQHCRIHNKRNAITIHATLYPFPWNAPPDGPVPL